VGIEYKQGVARIRITGSSGSLSSSDIVSALESSSLVEGEDYILGGKYSIYSTASLWFDTTGGTVEIGGSKFDFFGGIYSPNANTLITATPSVYGVLTTLSSPQRGGYISGVTIKNIDATGLILSDSFRDINQLSGFHHISVDGDLKSSVVGTHFSTASSDLKAGSIYYSTSSSRLWDLDGYRDIVIISTNAYMRANAGNIYDSDLYLKGVSYQIFWLPNDEEGINLYDVNFYNGNTLEKYSYSELDYYDYNLYNTNSSIKFYNS